MGTGDSGALRVTTRKSLITHLTLTAGPFSGQGPAPGPVGRTLTNRRAREQFAALVSAIGAANPL